MDYKDNEDDLTRLGDSGGEEDTAAPMWGTPPTKWFIVLCNRLGLASNLRVFPSNEIEKGALTMRLKTLKDIQDSLTWPPAPEELPVVSWEICESCVAFSRSPRLTSLQSNGNRKRGR